MPVRNINRKPGFAYTIPAVLFVSCLVHRSIQLYLLWPELVKHLLRADNVMQLLPAEIWREHFGAALLYLQQAPPIPNLVYGILAWLIADPQTLTLAVLFLQMGLACTSIALFSSLLLRLGLPRWSCLAIPAILFFGGDMVVMEYNAMGHFFYEQSTMLLCLLACHSALTYQRTASMRSVVQIGLWVALLALTRSTFSYFALPVALWIVLVSRPVRAAALVAFLVPVLLLQGGWSLKNLLVYGYWSVATSSWGGANARTGDIRRSGGTDMLRWLAEQEQEQGRFCDMASWEMAKWYKQAIFFFPNKDRVLSFPQPEEVLQANRRMAEARGRMVFFDTETFRLYSQCLQRIYLRYWLHNPGETLKGAWRSYQVFWLPIREFAARNPIPVTPPSVQEHNRPAPLAWLRQAVVELAEGGYRYAHLDLNEKPFPFAYEDGSLLVIPTLPLLLQTVNMFVFHGALLYLLVGAISRPARLRDGILLQFGFPMLCILYVASLTSLVEYGENMRFRIEVEPLIWLISALAISQMFRQVRAARQGREDRSS